MLPRPQEHTRDDEARDDEEDIDPEEAACRPAEDMEGDDDGHGHGPKALDVGPSRGDGCSCHAGHHRSGRLMP